MDSKTWVLIVDDDTDDVEFLREAVSDVFPGAEFHAAANGEEALQMLKKVSPLPSFIFLDLNMPRMDGKTFLSIVKNNTSYNKIPVIIYTTSSNSRDIELTRQMGAAYFLTKPTSFVRLCMQLENVISALANNPHHR